MSHTFESTFLVWCENNGQGFTKTQNGHWSFGHGAASNGVTNVALTLPIDCYLKSISVRCSSAPTNLGSIHLLKNNQRVYTMSNINTVSQVCFDGIANYLPYEANSAFALETALGSGGGVIRIVFQFVQLLSFPDSIVFSPLVTAATTAATKSVTAPPPLQPSHLGTTPSSTNPPVLPSAAASQPFSVAALRQQLLQPILLPPTPTPSTTSPSDENDALPSQSLSSCDQLVSMGEMVEQLHSDMVAMRRSVGTLHNGIAKIHNSASRTTHLTIGTSHNASKTASTNYTRLSSDLRLLGNTDDTIVLHSATGAAEFQGSVLAPNLTPVGTVIVALRASKSTLSPQWIDMTDVRQVKKEDYPEAAAARLLPDDLEHPTTHMSIPKPPLALHNTDDFVCLMLLR